MRRMHIVAIVSCVVLALPDAGFASQKLAKSTFPTVPAQPNTANGPDTTILNINDFHLWIDRRGFFPWTLSSSGSAGEYPPGSGAIFAAGIIWGAKVRDGGEKLVRANGSTYVSGLKAG
ncbi:MAG: hypothetical protein IH971_09210, partial [Candidatus Marinimicrobia bacterium]|nr:hypothetical protein [Candidatus Neomarinimicrobiota bacterium]